MHFAQLDVFRGVAIFMVFLLHSMTPVFGFDRLPWSENGILRSFENLPLTFLPMSPALLGWAGVAVFFVVSGFCIHLSVEGTGNRSWMAYFVRRWFRIYPPYVAAVVLFSFILVHPFDERPDAWQLISHFLLLHNFDSSTYYGINGSLWSIAVEWQLYLLYPVLRWMMGKWGVSGALGLTAMLEITLRTADGIGATWGSGELPTWLRGAPLFFWFSWALGAAIAELHLRGRLVRMNGMIALLPALGGVVSYFIKPLVPLGFPLFAVAAGLVLIASLQVHVGDALHGSLRTHTWHSRAAAWMGGHFAFAGTASYSLYLFHQPLLFGMPLWIKSLLARDFIPPIMMLMFCLLMWIPMVLLSRGAFLLLERPSSAAGRRLAVCLTRVTPSVDGMRPANSKA
jgi:peptidoglycan/LPS O-acetylase OafA/YrhL